MNNWLLFLGAGASVARPSRLPAFAGLVEGVMGGIGWSPDRDATGRALAWSHPTYGTISAPAMPAEVLFGTLRSLDIDFARSVAKALSRNAPNAAHHLAAQVLQAGGCVWTTNVDRGVEDACLSLGMELPRTGPAAAVAPELFKPLQETGPGTLVKFHGSVENPATMAFTHRELLAPLPSADVELLTGIAAGRDVVLYGYAGADADLADLLDEVFRKAGSVTWFEPSGWTRRDVGRAFPGAPVNFVPATLSPDRATAVGETGTAFVAYARAAGATLDNHEADALATFEDVPPPPLELPTPPAIAYARLVERFGDPKETVQAYRRALWTDLRQRQARGLRGFVRWRVGRSLYNDGIVASLVAWIAAHRWLLQRLRPRQLREWLVTRAAAVLLLRHNWRNLGEFADWAVRHRSTGEGTPNPIDLYYRAQARRYELNPTAAAEDATDAVAKLAQDLRDPERLAGALYEAGSAALYHADFERALRYAFDLRFRRGRFAIPRWQAWGAWLEAVAQAHLGNVAATREPLTAAEERFTAEKRQDALYDVRTALRLAERVALATTGAFDEAVLHDPADERRRYRYRDDLDLTLAEFAIARGDLAEADRRLARVHAQAAAPVSSVWARLGSAELRRLRNDAEGAADEFAALTTLATDRDATWLRVQSIIGLAVCGDARAEGEWQRLQEHWPPGRGRRPEDFAVGSPRVLWLFTV